MFRTGYTVKEDHDVSLTNEQMEQIISNLRTNRKFYSYSEKDVEFSLNDVLQEAENLKFINLPHNWEVPNSAMVGSELIYNKIHYYNID
ncbi:MAG TPA: hypothetical protein PLP33_25260 [Leptospiraceae bacterium]|nr:hypothetical protein [Leptospiraceae bacterium]